MFSFRRFLIGNLILFLIFSMLCAFATSLTEMIIWRGLQGFSGGVMIPMAFTRVLTTLPKHQQPIGLAAFAMTATFGPSIGPTIGGYLTENYGWQYIFFVNIVPSALLLGLLYPTLERTRMDLALLREGDWLGIAFMVVGLASLQTVLDEGNQDDWFGSRYIVHLPADRGGRVADDLRRHRTGRRKTGRPVTPAARTKFCPLARSPMSLSASPCSAQSICCRPI